ncbi:MAG: glutamine synthetase [Aureispira sp.]|nr:glutamine synthetase [Aureispira sp.]
MNITEIIQELKESNHTKVKVAIVDIDGVLRGKFMSKEKFLSAIESNFGFCNVVFGWDAADVAYDNTKMSGWHTGYPDVNARIDANTYRSIPWENKTPFFLGDFSQKNGNDLAACPRSLLKKVIAEAKELGYAPVFSQEFEWFNFRETPETLEEKNFQNLKPLTPGMFGYSILRASENSAFFHDLFDLLGEFNIPIEGLHTETGPGVYEAAIAYGDILDAADKAALFKTAVKEIGYKHGIIASFMAKQNMELPGCSGHVHQSLWDVDKKKNLFFDNAKEDNISELMQSYIAGQLHCLPYVLPMYAPTINSYKRLVEGAWAPTTITWGLDNRTTALRALPLGEKSARLETRVVGSDVNPYLAMAACLASGLYGIKKGLKLDVPKTLGNGYEDLRNGLLPTNLIEASNNMKNSDLAKELFGDDFVDHFTRTREWEWRQFASHVTDWETKRYFEII